MSENEDSVMIVDSDSDGEGGGEEEDAGMDIKNPPK